MTANIGEEDYLSNMGGPTGVRVLVQNQLSMPHPEDEGYLAKPGELMSMGVRRVRRGFEISFGTKLTLPFMGFSSSTKLYIHCPWPQSWPYQQSYAVYPLILIKIALKNNSLHNFEVGSKC